LTRRRRRGSGAYFGASVELPVEGLALRRLLARAILSWRSLSAFFISISKVCWEALVPEFFTASITNVTFITNFRLVWKKVYDRSNFLTINCFIEPHFGQDFLVVVSPSPTKAPLHIIGRIICEKFWQDGFNGFFNIKTRWPQKLNLQIEKECWCILVVKIQCDFFFRKDTPQWRLFKKSGLYGGKSSAQSKKFFKCGINKNELIRNGNWS